MIRLHRTTEPVRLLAFLVAALSGPGVGSAAVVNADPTNYLDVLSKLSGGDTMLLAPGIYANGLLIADMHGSAEDPIVVRGPDDGSAVFTADDCCNTVQLDTASHITISSLTLDGSGTNGAFGVASRGPCHDITVENLKIINYGAGQQIVGISTKGPAWNWIIRRNTVIGAGTGMYLGDSDGTAPFVNGLIEYNLVADTIGYNLQIKHQEPRPASIGLPTSDTRTVIRHNVWSKRHNASVGEMARPNVLVGHYPLHGIGMNDRYEIYGNFFYQNPTEALFQGEGNIALHDNVFVNPYGDAINIQAHRDKPRTVDVYHNTVVAAGRGIRISGQDKRFSQRIIGNAVFAADPVVGPDQQENITGTLAASTQYLNSPIAEIEALDLVPQPGRLTGPAIDLARFERYVDAARDFNGNLRTGTIRGAYAEQGVNTGWKLALSIKPEVAPVTGRSTPPTPSPSATSH